MYFVKYYRKKGCILILSRAGRGRKGLEGAGRGQGFRNLFEIIPLA